MSDIVDELISLLLVVGGEIVGVVAGVWFATWMLSRNNVREPYTCDLPFLLTLPFLAFAIFVPVFGLVLFGLVGGSVVFRVKTRMNREMS